MTADLSPAPSTTGPEPLPTHQLWSGAVAGLVAAVLLPDRTTPGVAWVLAAWTLAAAVLIGRRGAPRPDAWQLACGATALALGSLPVWTADEVTVVLALLAAAGLAVLATAGGRTWRAVVAPALRTVVVATGTFGAATSTLQRVTRDHARAPLRRHLATAATTLLLLAVFGSLFASADATFARLVDTVVPTLSIDVLLARVVVAFVLASVALVLVRSRVAPQDDEVTPPRGRLHGSQWQIPVGALVVLFAAFVAVQPATLFGGDEVVQGTAGLTYADHAREGFAQLLTAGVLTLGVVGVIARHAVVDRTRDRRRRAWLLGALCLLTLVVLASAFHRLSLYEDAFGATPDRLTARATIVWLAGVFTAVLALGAVRHTGGLPRTLVLWTGVALLGFGLLRPDALIARTNVDRFLETGHLDVALLARLSDDAATELARLPDPVRACVVERRRAGPVRDLRDPLAWNHARATAAVVLADPPTTGCSLPPPGPIGDPIR